MTLTSEVGYGFGILDSNVKITPFSGFNIIGHDEQEFSTGFRTQVSNNLNFELKRNQSFHTSGKLIESFNIGGSVKW